MRGTGEDGGEGDVGEADELRPGNQLVHRPFKPSSNAIFPVDTKCDRVQMQIEGSAQGMCQGCRKLCIHQVRTPYATFIRTSLGTKQVILKSSKIRVVFIQAAALFFRNMSAARLH